MRISDWSSDVCSSDLQQFDTLLRQLIAHLAPILGHHLARHDAMIDEPRQPVRQNVARDAELLLELLEMMDAVESGAQDHERPSLAHRFERERQGAMARSEEHTSELQSLMRSSYAV